MDALLGTGATKLCVALDEPDRAAVDRIVDATAPHADVFKIGLTSFYAHGDGLVADLAGARPLFLDLKLHDIPAQVAGAVRAIAGLGASFVTVHAAGGAAMMTAAAEAAGDRLTVLAVTVPTSLDDGDLAGMGVAGGTGAQVLRLAEIALAAGAGGLVCSPLEVAGLRARFGARGTGPLLVVPGIRPPAATREDQRRTSTPRAAAEAGADMIVVGRPITAAADPREAARLIAGEASL